MRLFLNWRKGLFDSDYQLFNQYEIKGSLLFNGFSNNARAIASRNYYYRTEGYTQPHTSIKDEKFIETATISYDLWSLKATIKIHQPQETVWIYRHGRLGKWSITSADGKEAILYHSNTGSGVIESDTDDELLLLTGLFIRSFYIRLLMLLILLFCIPFILRSF